MLKKFKKLLTEGAFGRASFSENNFLPSIKSVGFQKTFFAIISDIVDDDGTATQIFEMEK